MELVEQLMVLKRLSSYSLVGEIIIAIGLLIIFIYQKRKIGLLETQIKSQKGILESAEMFFKLFDLEKLKDYGEMLVEKTKVEKEIEFKRIETNLIEKIEKEKDIKKFLFKELFTSFKTLVDSFCHLPGILREEVLNSMNEGIIKEGLKGFYETLKEIDEKRRVALSEAFSIALKERKSESNYR